MANFKPQLIKHPRTIEEDNDHVGRHTNINARFNHSASSIPRLAYKTRTSVGCTGVDFPHACGMLHVACGLSNSHMRETCC